MVDFGGWDMPVQYSGVIDEHRTVRNAVGIFDVSHMGEVEIRGPEAAMLADFATTNHAAKLKIGQAQYSGLLYDHGGFVDDILVHKVADDHFFLCVNAANQEKDFERIRSINRFDAEVEFASERYAQIAIQGPKGRATVQKLTSVDLAVIKYYWFADGAVCGVPARIAHTGYTGEDGFEIYVDPSEVERVWAEAIAAGAEFGIKPCGLGARNTLRLESATKSTLPFRRSKPGSDGLSNSIRAISRGATRCCGKGKPASSASWPGLKCAAAASRARGMKRWPAASRRAG
jgi:aminomethyltransferase